MKNESSPVITYFSMRIPVWNVAAVAEWNRYWIVAGFVTSSSPVSLKTRRVGQRCTQICRELKHPPVGEVW
ncbi:hypothetical protein TNCV_4897921 [Trichonephila clavipes]|nr:hypothetical protein TNCV_4897921 [Trichonephila clavipes]